MNTPHNEWDAYLTQMEQLLALELDDARRAELRVQFSRIAAMAARAQDGDRQRPDQHHQS